MARVTDPALLQQLNGGETDPVLDMYGAAGTPTGGFTATLTGQAPVQQRKRVTDPALLQQLNGGETDPAPKATNAPQDDGTMVSRGLEALGSTDVARGIKQGLTNRGIGVTQLIFEGLANLGVIDPAVAEEINKAAVEAKAREDKAATGSGVGGVVGELVGDPINWIGGGKIGGATIRGLGKKEAVKVLAKQGARAGAITGAASGATGVRQDGETRLGNTAEGSATGAVVGAALPAGTRTIGVGGRGTVETVKDIGAAGVRGRGRSTKQLQNTVAEMKKEGGRLVQAMRDNNVRLSQQGTTGILEGVGDAIRKAGFSADIAPGEIDKYPMTRSLYNELQRRAEDGSLTVVSLDDIRSKMQDAMGSDVGVLGAFRRAMEEGLASPNSVEGSPLALDLRDQFLQQWQKSSRLQDVVKLAEKGNNDPGRIRTAVDNFTDDPEKVRFLEGNEETALRRAGSRNPLEVVLEGVGSFGVDLGSTNRKTRIPLPAQFSVAGGMGGVGGMAAGVGGAMGPLAAAPLVVGTLANSIRNRIANGKLERAIREIEARQVMPKTRPAAPAAAPMTPQLPGPQAPLALPAPETIMVPGGPGGALRAATPDERAAMYALRGKAPELEVPTAGQPRAMNPVQQQANASVRGQYQQMGLTPDILGVQRGNQVTAAEAQKAIQDAAAATQRTQQVAASAPPPSIGDMLQQSQASAADRAAVVGGPTPELGGVGQALLEAIRRSQGI